MKSWLLTVTTMSLVHHSVASLAFGISQLVGENMNRIPRWSDLATIKQAIAMCEFASTLYSLLAGFTSVKFQTQKMFTRNTYSIPFWIEKT